MGEGRGSLMGEGGKGFTDGRGEGPQREEGPLTGEGRRGRVH